MPIKSPVRAKKTVSREPDKKQAPLLPTSATIDFPTEGELILPGHYAVRISAPKDADIELSVDGGPWSTVRHSVGYRWFDWYPGKPGRHTLALRTRVGKGRWKENDERACSVVSAPKN